MLHTGLSQTFAVALSQEEILGSADLEVGLVQQVLCFWDTLISVFKHATLF